MHLLKNSLIILFLTLIWNHIQAQTPVANFSADITGGCSPIVVNFTDLSTGNPTNWSWDFGNGSTSTRQNPSTTYFAPGTYTVTLTVTNGNNSNTVTKTSFITVYDPPVADFSATNRNGCTPTVVHFSDLSATPPGTVITGWRWDFGDGSGSSTQQNPTYIYRTPGSYTVTLTITNDKGCSKVVTKPNYINPTQGVNATFNYNDPGLCKAPETINFINNSSGPGNLSYQWDLGNGNNASTYNASTTYVTNGNYTIRLFVISDQGCDDSTSISIQVGKVQTDFLNPASICPGTASQFTNNSSPRPIRANWFFSNNTTDNHFNGSTIFNSSGTYSVTLINTYSVCTDTIIKTITVQNGPTLNFFSADTGKCQTPFTVNFTNNSNGTSYLWNFGDNSTSTAANPSHTYNATGNFTVTLIATGANGCTDSLKKINYIRINRPIITFPNLPDHGCIPYTVNFLSNIQSSDPVLTYNWNFGDGSSASTATPSHTYTNPGTYTVTLTITTKGGCSETFSLANAVKTGTQPNPDFVANSTSGCADPGIQFTNLSTNAIDYEWQFSDGTSTTAVNPLHTFSDTGWISVTLKAINNGCENSVTKQRYVYIQPSISKFDYKPDCNNPLQYSFTDKSILAQSWTWNFGDGTSFIGQNPPIHIFPSNGTYTVSLTTSNGSCTYTASRTIEIRNYTPDVTVNLSENCKPAYFLFTPVLPNAPLFNKLIWDFGDGSLPVNPGHMSPAPYTYSNAGTYSITLSAIDTFGCPHSITKNNFIRVNGPTAKFGAIQASGCKGLNVNFIDSSVTDGRNSIVQWKWDFGDGTIQANTTAPFRHTYDSIGNFDVKLLVTDSKGCIDSITKREFVNISILKANYIATYKTCPGSGVYFTNKTKSDLPFSSIWDFGDRTNDTLNNPTHVYADTGYYTVKLIVKDILGCIDSVSKIDSMYVGKPKASFTANNFISYCPPFNAMFTNTSDFYYASKWDFSIGTSTQTNPSIYYTATGTYPVKLVITSPGDCKDSITHNVVIKDLSTAPFNYSPINGCRPLLVNFDAFSQMNGRFIWDFGDGDVIDTTINQINHIYDNYGHFTPKIILKEPTGCIIPLTGNSPIDIYGVKAKFNVTSHFYCDSGYVSIIDSTSSRDPIVSYNWDFGDGTQSGAQVPVHQYTQPGFYTIRLITNTQNGCSDTAQLAQPIKIVASPLISIQGDSTMCLNDKVEFMGLLQRPDTSLVRWQWVFPNGSSSIQQNPPAQFFNIPGTYTISLTAINSSGCKDSISKTVLVNALPTITAISPLTKIVGIPLVITPTYSSGVISYNWTPASTLDCSNCPSPTTTTKFSTLYRVEVLDSNNCKKDTAIQVNVLCPGATVFVPNTFSPNGDGSNDIFYVRGRGLERVKSFRIFNRWGQVVFEQKDLRVNDPNYGWDGRYKGNKPQSDVYVYQLEVYCENGEVLKFEGNVTLIQ